MSCSYAGCDNARSFLLSFFKFPNDHRREIWKKHSQRTDQLKKAALLCEAHFYAKDIKVGGTKKMLNKNTVPISCATVCGCTENVVDKRCYEILDSGRTNQKIIWNNMDHPPLSNKIKMDVDEANDYISKLKSKKYLKPKEIPQPIDLKQLPENTIIDTPPFPKVERTYRNTKLAPLLPDNVAEATKCNMSMQDQIQIASNHKKVECLEAVLNYTTQMQSIVKQNGGIYSIIQANSHLVTLLDKVVYEWFKRAQRCIEIGVITNELFIQKALEAKKIFCIQNFAPDREWLHTFKTKYRISDLDMRMWHIENNCSPLTVDINEIVLLILERNPLSKYFSNKNRTAGMRILEIENSTEMKKRTDTIPNTTNDIENIVKTEINGSNDDIDMQVQLAISNDEQARLHLKPLEEYVLLKDNLRAIGLISQLRDIFTCEIKKEET